MAHRKHTVTRAWSNRIKHLPFSPFSAIGAYAIILFLLTTSDAIMSYVSPVIIKDYVQNSFFMGLILAFSSFVGLISDFLLPEFFRKKTFRFFIWGTILTAFAFPSIFLLFKPSVFVFLVGMAIWGLYYEMNQFANYNVIHEYLKKEQHASGWGILYSFRSAAYLVAPLIVGSLSLQVNRSSLYFSLLFLFLGLAGFTLFSKIFPKKAGTDDKQETYAGQERPTVELRIWKILFLKIWPLYLFVFALFLLDSTFWTVGVLLSEQMRQTHSYGSL